jgi:hypothetical protein
MTLFHHIHYCNVYVFYNENEETHYCIKYIYEQLLVRKVSYWICTVQVLAYRV